MEFSPARKICAVVLSAASLFYVAGLIPSPQVSGATSNLTPVTSIVKPVNDAHVHHYVAKPHWYDPIWNLGTKAKTFFTCVIHVESRSTWAHPDTHDGDPALPGQYGIFQFTWPSKNNVWDAYIFPVLHVEPRYASAFQQAEGAAILWKLGPGEVENTWTNSDGCRV
jgi:hypothetical protein